MMCCPAPVLTFFSLCTLLLWQEHEPSDFLHVTLSLLVTSHTITHLALCVTFVGPPLLGRIKAVLNVIRSA